MARTNGRRQIENLAHSIWEAEGRPEGRAATHWAEAEYQLFGSAGYDESMDSVDLETDAAALDVSPAIDAGMEAFPPPKADGAISVRKKSRAVAR